MGYAVNSVPAQLVGALSESGIITNAGSSTVYLGSSPNVSEQNAGISLAPNQAVNFGEDQTLYAVCASGESSTVNIQYGAGFTVSPVTDVEVSGTVDIGTPVNVQGGGEVLDSGGNLLVPTSDPVVLTINAPPSGLTYYGLKVEIEITSGSPAGSQITWALDGMIQGGVANVPLSSQGITAGEGNVTCPFVGSYPLTLTIVNEGVSNVWVNWSIKGVSAADPQPQSDNAQIYRDARRLFSGGATNATLYLNPSFTPFKVVLFSSTLPTNIERWIWNGAAFVIATGQDARPIGSRMVEVIVPGAGVPQFIQFDHSASTAVWCEPY